MTTEKLIADAREYITNDSIGAMKNQIMRDLCDTIERQQRDIDALQGFAQHVEEFGFVIGSDDWCEILCKFGLYEQVNHGGADAWHATKLLEGAKNKLAITQDWVTKATSQDDGFIGEDGAALLTGEPHDQ